MKGPLSYSILAISLLSTTSLIFKPTSFRSHSQSLHFSSNTNTNNSNNKIGIIIIDHGSKKKEANEGLIKVLLLIRIYILIYVISISHIYKYILLYTITHISLRICIVSTSI